ncbi:hypothetical protein ABKN59_001377 [Abortiporus biennis]
MMDLSHSEMPSPLDYSSSSEGTELRDFVDSKIPRLPPDINGSVPSAQSVYRSSSSSDPSFRENDRRSSRRSSKKDRRHSGTKEMVKWFFDEEIKNKESRGILRATLAKLDAETHRAQEAERRALEIAERFRVVNEARLTAQTELDRTKHELSLYKIQYTNAQQEIHRGQEILKDLEAQRDDAEASAARARTTARRLKEEQLMSFAREEGRKQGFEEGMRRGFEEGRVAGYRRGLTEIRIDDTDAGEGDDNATLNTQADTLDGLPVRNFPIAEPSPQLAAQQFDPEDDTAGIQGSRFQENGMTPDTAQFTQPVPLHEPPPQPHHPETPVPPDNFIPHMDPNNGMNIPPAHEFSGPPPSPHSPSQQLPVPIPPPRVTVGVAQTPESFVKDYGYTQQGRGSPRSFADSLQSSQQSTNLSQYELVTDPRARSKSGLSVIHEVSSSMEYSPGKDSSGMPEPVVFPVPSAENVNEWGSDHSKVRSQTPRSRKTSSRLGEEVRYSNPDVVDEWRRDAAADEVRTSSPKPNSRPRSAVTTSSPLAESARSQSHGASNLGYGRPQSPSVVAPPLADGARSQSRRVTDEYGRPTVIPPPPAESVRSHSRGASSLDYGRPRSSVASPSPLGDGIRTHSRGASSVDYGRPRSPSGARPMTPSSMQGRGTPVDPRLRRSDTASSRGGRDPRNSSTEISINIEPPSAPESTGGFSPIADNASMLSPNAVPQQLPRSAPTQHVLVPTEPNSPAMRQPSLGQIPSPAPFADLPPGFIPTGPIFPVGSPLPPNIPPLSSPIEVPTLTLQQPPPRDRTPTDRRTSSPPWPVFPVRSGRNSAEPLYTRSRKDSRSGSSSSDSIPAGPKTPTQSSSAWGSGIAGRPPSSMSNRSGSQRPNTAASGPQYAVAPTPAGLQYPDPPFIQAGGRPDPPNPSRTPPSRTHSPTPLGPMSPRSTTSRLSTGAHQRSLSLNAGMTPVSHPQHLPASTNSPPKLRRVPSAGSITSNTSRKSGISHFDPNKYVDIAYLASSDDLTASMVQSPNTKENTKANAGGQSVFGLSSPVAAGSTLSFGGGTGKGKKKKKR